MATSAPRPNDPTSIYFIPETSLLVGEGAPKDPQLQTAFMTVGKLQSPDYLLKTSDFAKYGAIAIKRAAGKPEHNYICMSAVDVQDDPDVHQMVARGSTFVGLFRDEATAASYPKILKEDVEDVDSKLAYSGGGEIEGDVKSFFYGKLGITKNAKDAASSGNPKGFLATDLLLKEVDGKINVLKTGNQKSDKGLTHLSASIFSNIGQVGVVVISRIVLDKEESKGQAEKDLYTYAVNYTLRVVRSLKSQLAADYISKMSRSVNRILNSTKDDYSPNKKQDASKFPQDLVQILQGGQAQAQAQAQRAQQQQQQAAASSAPPKKAAEEKPASPAKAEPAKKVAEKPASPVKVAETKKVEAPAAAAPAANGTAAAGKKGKKK